MKTSFFLLLCSILIFCESHTVLEKQEQTKIRVINNSSYELTNLALFSMRFNNLLPGDSTAYQVLEYDELKDDPMIYCIVDQNNLSLFLKKPENEGNFTYSIDSLDLTMKRIYFKMTTDN